MNNDRFDDALRRKLEEVNPVFQDKNWTQLQRFMGSRGYPPSIWQSSASWLQPALTAAAAASLLIVSIWQYRTNQTLTDRIQTLTSTVARLERVQTNLQQTTTAIAAPPRADTVYVVQQVPVYVPTQPPGRRTASSTSENELVAPKAPAIPAAEPTGVQPASSTDRLARQASPVSPPTPTTSERTSEVVTSLPMADASRSAGVPASQPTPDESVAGRQPQPTRPDRSVASLPANALGAPVRPSTGQSSAGIPTSANTSSMDEVPSSVASNVPAQPADVSGQVATVNAASGISALSQSGDLADAWQRRLRRVRYRSPFVSAAPTVASGAPQQRPNPEAVRYRLGVGGDLTTSQTNIGVYGELLLNNRLTISVGIGRSNWSGVVYQSEAQFNDRIKRDFQKEYLGGGPPGGGMAPGGPLQRPQQVFDINWSGASLVVPVQLGYRIDVSKQLAVNPFVGMNLSLNPTETIEYSYEGYAPHAYQRINLIKDRPVSTYSSWSLGFGLERPLGPFVAQLSPMVTVPMASRDNSLNSASVGLRARLYYRF